MQKSIVLIAALTVAGLSSAQQRQRPGGAAAEQPTPAAAPAARPTGPPPEERSSVTKHKGRFGGQDVNYTATAATYNIKDDAGTVKATFFFASYTKDDADVARRPLSFVYNGGPGSASLFTHMGLGPRQPVLTDDGHGTPAPYLTEDNPSSFLDATDMVFIDAVTTGYSRTAPGENPTQFYGVAQDATIFSDFVYQYVTRNQRWASPKFLIGESYGTTRSAMLANTLQQRHQMYLNGVALLSSVGFGNWGADDRTKYFLPTFTVSAWFHKLLPPDLQKLPIEEVAKQARQFAHGEYAHALEMGDELSATEHQKAVKDLARFTGLSTSFIEQANMRISPQRWFKELQRGKRLTTGRLDARFTGLDVDAAGERVEYDSSEASYEGVYVGAFQDYIRRELKWTSDMYYTVSANVRPWDQGTAGAPAEALRSAMTQQTTMKLLVICGYYDHATPFNGIEQTVSHMMLEPAVRKNVSFTYYEAGHMMYVDKKSREKLHKDVTQWINASFKP